jgi:nitrogen fixation/metabolism regulation signal transduction histidine kinase
MTTSVSPPAAAGGARPKYKRSIKNYMLEPRFQLKWTGYLLAVALVVSGLLGAFLLRTSNEVTEQSAQVIAQGNKLLDESKKNSDLVRMTIKEQYQDAPELAGSFNKEADDIDKKLQEQHKQLEAQAAATKRQQQTMMMSLVGGLSFLVVLIGLVGIFITHKVVGPIYKMKMLLRQVGDGKLNFYGKPRKGDELQDLFEVFSATVEKLKARQAAEVEELTEAMAEAKATGASESALKKIEHVRDEMKAALEK